MKRRESGESISVWVGRWLIRKGYVLASYIGRVSTETKLVESDSIGLLIPRQENSEPAENSFRNPDGQQNPQKRPFVGVLWFNNRKREADNKNWVLEVYREEYFESLRVLARELWSDFYVSVEARFVENQPKDEAFLSDLDLLLKDETISEEGVV